MRSKIRKTLAVLAGFVAASTVMMLCEYTNSRIFTFPSGFDTQDIEQVRAFAASLPLTALILVFVGWVLGSTFGGWVATKVAQSVAPQCALITGALLTLGGMFNAWMIQNPLWFFIGGLPIFMLCSYLGFVLTKK